MTTFQTNKDYFSEYAQLQSKFRQETSESARICYKSCYWTRKGIAAEAFGFDNENLLFH